MQLAPVCHQPSGITARRATYTSAVLSCTQSTQALTVVSTRLSAMCVVVSHVTAMSLRHIFPMVITVGLCPLSRSLKLSNMFLLATVTYLFLVACMRFLLLQQYWKTVAERLA